MKLAIYDFDGTYIDTQLVPRIFDVWRSCGLDLAISKPIWRKIILWYVLHIMKIGWSKEVFRRRAMAATLTLLYHLDDTKRTWFMHKLYEHLKPHIRHDMQTQLQKDKQEGYTTVLLSGGFDIIIEPFKAEGFDHTLGTKSSVNGQPLHEKDLKFYVHEEKVKAIQSYFKHFNPENAKAYADTYQDLPLLIAVKEGYAYRPDRKLRKAIQTYGLHLYGEAHQSS
jgi:phosphoserine phosphatase